MKFFKKMIMLVISLCLISTSTTFAQNSEGNKQNLKSRGFKEIIATDWNKGKSKEDASTKNKIINEVDIYKSKVVIHNNGKPIDTDIVIEKQGNELFAVTSEVKNGTDYETYYFSNTDSIDMNSVFQEIVSADVNAVSASVVGTGSYIRTYNWNFYRTIVSGQLLVATMSDSVEYNRQSSTVDINGTQGSLWDVKSTSQVLRNTNDSNNSSDRLNEKTTTLDAGYASQQLLSWGPLEASGDMFNVGLAGIVPTAYWSFATNGFNLTDLSNKASKYAKWKFSAPWFGANTGLLTQPGVRITNTSGSLGLKLSHTVNFNFSNHATSVIVELIPDR